MTLQKQTDHLNAFMRTAQYLAGLTTAQDAWAETSKLLVTFWAADFAGFSERAENGDIIGHHWTFSDEMSHPVELSSELKKSVSEVLDDGFLTSRMISATPEPLSTAFLPVTEDKDVRVVLLVGHRMSELPSKELLNTYLGLAGLVSLTLTRLASEQEARNQRNRLEEMVKERTAQLTWTNKQLQEEAAQRRQTNEFLYNVLESLPHPFYVINPNDYTIELANSAAASHGLTPNSTCYSITHGRDTPCNGLEHPCPLKEVKKTKRPVIMLHVHKDQDSTPRDFEVHAYPILDSQGRVGKMIEYVHDITERKEAELRLQDSEELHRTTISNISDAIFITDNEGDFTYVSPNAHLIFGYSQKEIEALGNVGYLVDENLFDMSRLESLGEIRNVEATIKDKLGRKHSLLVNVKRVNIKDGTILYVCRDITNRKRAEEALIESEARLTEAEQVGKIGNWEWNALTNEAYWSPGIYRIFGVTPEEFAPDYEGHLKFIPAEDLEGYERKIRECLSSKQPFEYEHRVASPVGEIKTVWVHGYVMLDDLGSPIGMRGTMQDITERVLAEMELQKSNALLRAIIEAAPAAIIGLDLDGNVRMVWNPTAEKMLGWSAQEVMGRPLPSVPAEKQEEFRGFREQMHRGETLDGVEVRRQRRDGSPIDYSIYASPLRDARGRITGNICVLVDMTDRRRAEQALRASEEKYRTLFEESMDGVYSVLRDGQIIDANKSFCDIFGCTREQMIGKSILESCVNPADRQRFMKEIEERGFVRDCEMRLRKRDGTEADCLVTASVQFAKDGSIVGYRGIMRDLTVYKSLQKQLLQAQKMESLATLAGGIAHDFNNLLQMILGYSEVLLQDNKKDTPDYNDLQAIHQAAHRGADLVKQILTYSRRVETHFHPVDVNAVVRETVRLLCRTIPKMIKIETDLEDELGTILADDTQIGEILLNLAVNAKDAMPDGGRLTIRTGSVALDQAACEGVPDLAPGEYVRIEVSDTGHGMESHVVELIFEPFFTTKKPGEGTGLGLSSVFGIVKMHRGHISCESRPGGGTGFEILLPAKAAEPEASVSTEKAAPEGRHETLLVVDDEPLICELANRILSSAGYNVLVAVNGREAVETFGEKHREIALVLLDLIMPEMGGKECLKELLKIDAQAKVLIASGFAVDASTRRFLDTEAKGSVTKPFKTKELLTSVRRVIDRA